MTTVHVVTADFDYSSNTPLRAFFDKAGAEKFAQQCREYEASRPRCPEVADPDEDWQAYLKADEQWRAGHPGGDGAISANYFTAWPVHVDGASAE